MNERNEHAKEAALCRELQDAATDNDTRTIARIMAEIAEEAASTLLLKKSADI